MVNENKLADATKARRKSDALLERIKERFAGGTYPIGSMLPKEDKLCEEFAVSRFTLREALNTLEQQGYIQRKRRAGTRVLAHQPRTLFRHPTGSQTDLQEFVRGTILELSEPQRIHTDGTLARLLGCDEMREWHFMQGIRMDAADQRPIGITKIYIDPIRAELPDNADFGGRPIYEWLQETQGIHLSTVSQDISAVSLSPAEADVFGERAGAPALKMVRRYFDDQQRIFQIAVTIHRSEDFIYNIRIHQDA